MSTFGSKTIRYSSAIRKEPGIIVVPSMYVWESKIKYNLVDQKVSRESV